MIFYDLSLCHIKTSYYLLNKDKLLENKDRYQKGCSKEQAAEYYLNNREVLRKVQEINRNACLKKKKK